MMKILRTLIAAALVAAPIVPAHAINPGETVDVSGWKIHHARNADGTFKQCNASSGADDDPTNSIGFSITAKKQGILLISHPGNMLRDKQVYQVKVRIDNEPEMTIEGAAIGSLVVVAAIDKPDGFFDAVRKGDTMVTSVGGHELAWSLDGTDEALEALTRCARDAAG